MSASIRVCLVRAPAPRNVQELWLELAAGASVAQALQAAGWRLEPGLGLGIWNRRVSADQPLRTGDRVELYRPLTVDPKLARRQRFERQGRRGTGLFAKPVRPGRSG